MAQHMHINSAATAQQTSARSKPSLAKRLVQRVFKRLEKGELVVFDGDECRTYGEAGTGTRAVVYFNNPAAYREIVFGGTVGAAEAYVRQEWTSPELVEVLRLFVQNIKVVTEMDSGLAKIFGTILKVGHRLFSRNTLTGSRKNIEAHYDLGNDMFELFLDSKMMYSSAIYPSESATLEEAQDYRLHRICRKLDLQPGDHLLEIGTGWGGMAIHAAKHYGCRVTTTTISREQYELARQRVQKEGLEDRVTVLLEDYRKLSGQYDKLVSIEMIEAVGYQYYNTFFETCAKLLKEDGIMLMQAILTYDQYFEKTKNDVDFIKRYIFPGSCIPSLKSLLDAMTKGTDMMMTHVEDITEHYARTLKDWRERFLAQRQEILDQGYSEEFIRLWEYYFAYCEVGFAEREIHTKQIMMARRDNRRRHVLGEL